MLISQAPSKEVCKFGQKWRDNLSGKTLRGWFGLPDEVFYDEDKFYITSLGKCYPGKKKNGDKLPDPICAETWLKEEIKLVKPKLIVTIGKSAFKWFFPELDYDSNLRGEMLNWGSAKVYPLPHPSGANVAWRTRNKGRMEKIIENLRINIGKSKSL